MKKQKKQQQKDSLGPRSGPKAVWAKSGLGQKRSGPKAVRAKSGLGQKRCGPKAVVVVSSGVSFQGCVFLGVWVSECSAV